MNWRISPYKFYETYSMMIIHCDCGEEDED